MGWPALLSLGILAWCCHGVNGSGDATVIFDNRAHVDIDVFWRDAAHHQWLKLARVIKGMTGQLQTFAGHKFIVTEAGVKPDYFSDEPNYVQARVTETVTVTGEGDNALTAPDSTIIRVGGGGGPPPAEKATATVRNTGSGDVWIYWKDEKNSRYSYMSELKGGRQTVVYTWLGHQLMFAPRGYEPEYEDNPANYRQDSLLQYVTVEVVPKSGDVRVESSFYDPHAEASYEEVVDAVKLCGRDPKCITNGAFRNVLAGLGVASVKLLDAREEMQETYHDFMCAQHENMLPAQPRQKETWKWTGRVEGFKGRPSAVTVKVDHLFDRPGAQIYLLDNFIRPDECKALKDRASPGLTQASISGVLPGEHLLSKTRKAQSAPVMPKYEDPYDILVPLRQRVFDFATEHSNGDTYTLPGQEPFSVIKYNVSGDEYRLHCDGDCNGGSYKPGGRVATMLMFCEEATRGGQTTFPSADIMVKAKPGQAIYIHYKDDCGYMDLGWTRHGGCPVLEGTKWIASQWIRQGVSDDNPWTILSPSGDRANGGEATHQIQTTASFVTVGG